MDLAGKTVTTITNVSSTMKSQRGLITAAGRYDLLIWLLTLGRETRFRELLLAPARLRQGESVLDVGCGTGALAFAAKKMVGPTGTVYGIDASAPMIARAKSKVTRKGIEAHFDVASADALPFPDRSFDVVLSTVMLHHLPKTTRVVAVSEMRRVVASNGRVLLVDFAGARNGKGPRLHFHRHGHVDPRALVELAVDAGLRVVDSGPVGKWQLQYVLAAKQSA
jgi:ubiquinone/menaquinone biosynthesis C-methylase UbiE